MKCCSFRMGLSALLLTLAGVTHATVPVITKTWPVESIVVGTEQSIPTSCDSSTVAAINIWNSVGAKFYFYFDAVNYQPRVADQTLDFNRKNITIENGAMDEPAWIMNTMVDVFVSDPTKIANADIYVDERRINQPAPVISQLNCSTSLPIPFDKIDWQTAILHELGHAVGFGHTTDDRTCSMYHIIDAFENRRAICEGEKQAYLTAYGKAFSITSIPNVTGPQSVNIPAKVFYDGSPQFPVTRRTAIVQCVDGWDCSNPYVGTYSSNTPSPLTFNFKCEPRDPMPTATFRWRTTLTNANGLVTNAVEHTSTCTSPPGGAEKKHGGNSKGVSKIIITN